MENGQKEKGRESFRDTSWEFETEENVSLSGKYPVNGLTLTML